MKNIVSVLHGSNLYGTAVEGSDRDIKEVVQFPLTSFLTFKVTPTTHTQDSIQDIERFELYHFLDLVTQGTSPCLEMLFAPKSHQLLSTPIWEELLANRKLLLNRKLQGIARYAQVQASKYSIKGDRLLAVQAAISFLEDQDQNAKLGEVSLNTLDLLCTEHKHILRTSVLITNETNRELGALEVCGRKFLLTNQISYIVDCLRKVEANYGSRAKTASQLRKSGKADWKACMHALRIAEQGIELATMGEIILPRPNAEYLKCIRNGILDFNQIMEEITSTLEKLDNAIEISSLPEESDWDFIKDFCIKKGLDYPKDLAK